MAKFTFKTHNPTGKYRAFDTAYIDIKLNKKVCGSICEPSHHSSNGCVIRLMVKDASHRCGWRWIQFKAQFDTLKDARTFVSEKSNDIQSKYDLFLLED